MIIAHDNEWPAATLTESAQVSSLPAENTQVMPVRKPWRVSATSGYIDADFGAAVSLQDFAMPWSNLTTAATHRIELSTVSAGANDVLDTGTVSAGVLAGYPEVYYSHASALSAQYMRWTFTDATLTFLDIGYIFAGVGWRPTRGPAIGDAVRWADGSDIEETIGGQLLTNTGPRFRVADFELNGNSESEVMTNALELDRLQGITANVLVRLDPTNYPVAKTIFGPLVQATPIIAATFASARKRYSVRQRL